jgi:hypothetical protein
VVGARLRDDQGSKTVVRPVGNQPRVRRVGLHGSALTGLQRAGRDLRAGEVEPVELSRLLRGVHELDGHHSPRCARPQIASARLPRRTRGCAGRLALRGRLMGRRLRCGLRCGLRCRGRLRELRIRLLLEIRDDCIRLGGDVLIDLGLALRERLGLFGRRLARGRLRRDGIRGRDGLVRGRFCRRSGRRTV